MSGSIHDRLKTEKTPLIDHNDAIFVWRGKAAPHLVGDFTGWDDGNPVNLVDGKLGTWTYQLTLPDDAYIEYSFMRRGKSLEDPLNPRRTPNGVGGYNNYFSMPCYKPTELARRDPAVPHGTVTHFHLSTQYLIAGNKRTIHLYQPPTTERVPLVVVWDGQEYLRRVRLNVIVDNLVAQGRIHPVALAFIENGGQETRGMEYSCNEATLVFLMTEVMPLAYKELNLLDILVFPGEFGVIGASMGGLMALYTGTRLSHMFGKVMSQSGAFTWGGYDMVVFNLLERGDLLPLSIWLDVANYDLTGLQDSNRRMQSVLREKRYSLTYREYNAGHNYPAWRDEIWRGLEVMYGTSQ